MVSGLYEKPAEREALSEVFSCAQRFVSAVMHTSTYASNNNNNRRTVRLGGEKNEVIQDMMLEGVIYQQNAAKKSALLSYLLMN